MSANTSGIGPVAAPNSRSVPPSGSTLVAVGSMAARGLAFLFSVVVARSLSPEGFGAVQFAIGTAFFITVFAQPIGQHVVARYVAIHRAEPGPRSLSAVAHLWILFASLLVLSLVAAAVVAQVSATLNLFLLSPVAGIACYHAYFGLSRGHDEPSLIAAVYIASNGLQLLAAVAAFVIIGSTSSTTALAIYGLSYFPVIIGLQLLRPLPTFASRITNIDGELMRQVAKFSAPVVVSNLVFMAFLYADVLALQPAAGSEAVGRYSLAKTLATVFYVVPSAISTVLLPSLLRPDRAGPTGALASLKAPLLLSSIGIAVYIPIVGPFVSALFGPEYELSTSVHAMLAIAMTLLGLESILGTMELAAGRPGVEARVRLVGLLVLIAGCVFAVPRHGEAAAAASLLAAAAITTLGYGMPAIRRSTIEA